ncbi:MAG: regulatory protein TetR [Gemmatimonadetes bacterium]|jgi:AcrR family transcriptional regulator|nr:regulatory protein TetR [Gemmatimonadota bacterium]
MKRAPQQPVASTTAAPPVDGGDCRAAAILSCLRRPQQERGERRVSAILDAAAALITEVGPDNLTVQALAERACTSRGSLYHFFPDLPSVLRALAERHVQAIGELTRAQIADRSIDWGALSVEATVQHFVAPLAYLERHPDLLALARTQVMVDEHARRLTPLCDLAEHILRERYPALDERERLLRSSTMVAVVDGVVGYSLRSTGVTAREMVVELGRVLAGYLRDLESGIRNQDSGIDSDASRGRHAAGGLPRRFLVPDS